MSHRQEPREAVFANRTAGAASSSIQIRTAYPVARYSAVSARCACEDTIRLLRAGEWVHPVGLGGHSNSAYCRETGR